MEIKSQIRFVLALSVAVSLLGCANQQKEDQGAKLSRGIEIKQPEKEKKVEAPVREEAWREKLAEEVADLGARNWILVTEKAFPIPEDPGVHVVHAQAMLPETLQEVFEAIDSEGHIWPRIFRLREFQHVEEDYAPGVKKLEKEIQSVLAERESQELTRKTVQLMIKAAMKEFRILIVKSESAYPYCSLFMELDSGYWNGDSEDALRKHMSQ